MSHGTKWRRECIRAAEDLGITEIEIEPGGKHMKLRGVSRSGPVMAIVRHSATRNHRAAEQFKMGLRRAIREAAEGQGQRHGN